jgi:Transposase
MTTAMAVANRQPSASHKVSGHEASLLAGSPPAGTRNESAYPEAVGGSAGTGTIVAKMNKALDEVRTVESRKVDQEGHEPLRRSRAGASHKRKENLTSLQKFRLRDLLRLKMTTLVLPLGRIRTAADGRCRKLK